MQHEFVYCEAKFEMDSSQSSVAVPGCWMPLHPSK